MRIFSKFSTLALLATPGLAHAASINWGQPFELVTDADIDLTHPVVYALNAGDTTGNPTITNAPVPAEPLIVTIGGQAIAFEGVEAIYGVQSTFGQMGFVFETFGDAIDHLAGASANVTFATTDTRTVAIPQVSVDKLPTNLFASEGRVYNVPTGNDELDVLLNSQVFFDGRVIGSSALNISLNNLTPGKQYQVQVIAAADSRTGSNIPSTVTLNDGVGGGVAGLIGYGDLDNDTLSHVTTVIGTFTADGISQAINAVLQTKRNGGISGLILTEIMPAFVPADLDQDGDVDDADFGIAFAAFTGPGGLSNSPADLDDDGDVDDADFGLAFAAFTGPGGQPVPEPTGLALLGLAGLGVFRRRRDE